MNKAETYKHHWPSDSKNPSRWQTSRYRLGRSERFTPQRC